MATFDEPVVMEKQLTLREGLTPGLARSNLLQYNLQPYTIPWTAWRQAGANEMHVNLPGTAATDDLALIGGILGTNSPVIRAGDLKAAGATTRYARAHIVLPAEYVAGQTVVLRFHAGVETTVADNTCTLDVEAYRSDEEGGISADLCATAATTINSLVLANKDFTITETTLVAGDTLDVRIAIACNDAATGTAVTPVIGAAKLLCDTKG